MHQTPLDSLYIYWKITDRKMSRCFRHLSMISKMFFLCSKVFAFQVNVFAVFYFFFFLLLRYLFKFNYSKPVRDCPLSTYRQTHYIISKKRFQAMLRLTVLWVNAECFIFIINHYHKVNGTELTKIWTWVHQFLIIISRQYSTCTYYL